MKQDEGPLQKGSVNTVDNLFVLSDTSKQRRTIIAGHKGGFKPDNTLHAFSTAKNHGIEAIELDVSKHSFQLFLNCRSGSPRIISWQSFMEAMTGRCHPK